MKQTSQLHDPICNLCMARARVWVLCRRCNSTYHQECLSQSEGCTECLRAPRSSSSGTLAFAPPAWSSLFLLQYLVWGHRADLPPLLRPSPGSPLARLRVAVSALACSLPVWGALFSLAMGWTDLRVQLAVLLAFAALPLLALLVVPRSSS